MRPRRSSSTDQSAPKPTGVACGRRPVQRGQPRRGEAQLVQRGAERIPGAGLHVSRRRVDRDGHVLDVEAQLFRRGLGGGGDVIGCRHFSFSMKAASMSRI